MVRPQILRIAALPLVLASCLSATEKAYYEASMRPRTPEPPVPPVVAAPGGEADWGLLAQLVGGRWLYQAGNVGAVAEFAWDVPGATMTQVGWLITGDTTARSTFYYVPGEGIETRLHVSGNYFGRSTATPTADGALETRGETSQGLPTSSRMELEAPDRVKVIARSLHPDGTLNFEMHFQYVRVTEAEERAIAAAYRVRQQEEQQRAASEGPGFLEWALAALEVVDVLSDPTGRSYNAFIARHVPELAPLAEVANMLIDESTGYSAGAGAVVGGTAPPPGSGTGAGAGAVAPGSYPTRPNTLDGQTACRGYTVDNYESFFERNARGPDVQLHTMCAAAYNYYAAYLNAIRQGYTQADSDRTYQAFQGAATVAIDFHRGTRTR